MGTNDVRAIVKEKYGEAARRVAQGAANACCGGSAATDGCCDPITTNLYTPTDAHDVPDGALRASLGCGS